MIYRKLRSFLDQKEVLSSYTSERPVDCRECDYEFGCCKQRKLMLAMVEKILKWLKEHKDELQDIDYADDVNLAQCHPSSSKKSDDSDEKSGT